MRELVIVAPPANNRLSQNRMESILKKHLPPQTPWLTTVEELSKCQHKRLLFAIALDEYGMNSTFEEMKQHMAKNAQLFLGSIAAVCVDGKGELFTKSVARDLVFRANLAGCAFIAKPLIEATGSLYNFKLRASLLGVGLEEAYAHHLKQLVDRLINDALPVYYKRPNLLVICSTNRLKDANSVCYWRMVQEGIGGRLDSDLVNLGKGKIYDCCACDYKACTERGCPRSDVLRDGLFDRIAASDAIMLLAPNLNDAIGADLTAFINRLTHLSSTERIKDQYIYVIVMSGYSGGDLLARQLLNALCLNKGFRLPPYFCDMQTANMARSILDKPESNLNALTYAENICHTLVGQSG